MRTNEKFDLSTLLSRRAVSAVVVDRCRSEPARRGVRSHSSNWCFSLAQRSVLCVAVATKYLSIFVVRAVVVVVLHRHTAFASGHPEDTKSLCEREYDLVTETVIIIHHHQSIIDHDPIIIQIGRRPSGGSRRASVAHSPRDGTRGPNSPASATEATTRVVDDRIGMSNKNSRGWYASSRSDASL